MSDFMQRGANGLQALPKSVTNDIWAKALDESVVQRLARKIDMPAGGVQVPTITGEPEAQWVKETEEKPASKHTVAQRTLTPYKIAVIEVFSDEFRRDHNALYNQLVQRLPKSIGKKFDQTVFGFKGKPGDDFATLADSPAIELDGTVDRYLDVLESPLGVEGDITSWIISRQAEIDAMRATYEHDGRSVLLRDIQDEGSIGSILARPVYKNDSVSDADTNTVGFAGDWSKAAWGAVEGIKMKVSDQSTVNVGGEQINLWQRNMFAVLVEAELAFTVHDTSDFVRLTKGADVGP